MQTRSPRIWTPSSPSVDWDSPLGSSADLILLPQKRQMVSRSLPYNFTKLSSGLIAPKPNGVSFSAAGGTSDGWSTTAGFDAISGATSLSLFVAMRVTSTTGAVMGRWSTAANFGGFLMTFESNCLATVVASTADLPLFGYAKRTGVLSPGVILYGMTWTATSSQDNYVNGVLNNGSVWFSGSPSTIQTVTESLYLNRHGDSGSGSGNGSIAFAAFGVNKVWSADTHREWARNYKSVFKPRRIWVPVSAGGGGVTGTLAATETGSDTAAFAGDVYVSGTLSVSETGPDTAAFAGDVYITGTLAASEAGDDTAAFTGTSAVVTTGYLAATETGSDTAAFAGDVYIAGALAASESGADTAAFSGDVYVSGTLAASESGSDTAAFTGTAAAAISGTLAASESGEDTAAFTNVTATAAGGYDDGKPKRKKRFFAEVDGKLLVYGTAKAAANALNRKADPEPAEQATSLEAPKPDVEIDLPAVEAFAKRTGQADDYKTALNNKHLEAILKMFSDMEDEDDVEMLLMSL